MNGTVNVLLDMSRSDMVTLATRNTNTRFALDAKPAQAGQMRRKP